MRLVMLALSCAALIAVGSVAVVLGAVFMWRAVFGVGFHAEHERPFACILGLTLVGCGTLLFSYLIELGSLLG